MKIFYLLLWKWIDSYEIPAFQKGPKCVCISKSFQNSLSILIFFGKIEKNCRISPNLSALRKIDLIVRIYTRVYPSVNPKVKGRGEE